MAGRPKKPLPEIEIKDAGARSKELENKYRRGGKKAKYIMELIATLKELDKERKKNKELTAKILDHNITLRELKKKEFLEVYRRIGVISRTAKEICVSVSAVRGWLKKDEKFKKQFEKAYEEVTDTLEAEAIRRAMEKSDSLLMFLLRTRKPEKFSEKLVVDGKLDNPSASAVAPVQIIFSQDEIGPADREAGSEAAKELVN